VTQGGEIHESIALTDVRFVAGYGLKSDIAEGPKSAISGRKPGRGQASKSALAWQSDLSYKVRHERFACHGA
jgi:hypothetical protein